MLYTNIRLGLLLLFLGTSSLGALPPQKWLSDLDSALQLARKKKQPLLLDIYAPWCTYCRKLQKKVYPSRELRQFIQKFISVRINGEKNKNLMVRYGARGFPTIVLLDSNGVTLDTIHGFIASLPLKRRLKEAYQKATRYQKLLAKLKQNPHSIYWNYKAGRYYFIMESYAKAREYFLRAWKLKSESKSKPGPRFGPKTITEGGGKTARALPRSRVAYLQKQALYNTAICSMHMDRYASAVYEWNLYLQHYPIKNKEYNYARYYRGLSYFYQGKKKAARNDLSYANKHLSNSEEGRNAKILLQTTP